MKLEEFKKGTWMGKPIASMNRDALLAMAITLHNITEDTRKHAQQERELLLESVTRSAPVVNMNIGWRLPFALGVLAGIALLGLAAEVLLMVKGS